MIFLRTAPEGDGSPVLRRGGSDGEEAAVGGHHGGRGEGRRLRGAVAAAAHPARVVVL